MVLEAQRGILFRRHGDNGRLCEALSLGNVGSAVNERCDDPSGAEMNGLVGVAELSIYLDEGGASICKLSAAMSRAGGARTHSTLDLGKRG